MQEFQHKLKDKLQEALIGPFDDTNGSPGVPLLQESLDQEVHRFVRYFQGPGEENFERASKRSIFYRDMMERIFREEGLPTELVFLAQIESGFDPIGPFLSQCSRPLAVRSRNRQAL